MITADQLLAHALGDYLLQSHWMATEKTKQSLAAAIHAVCYFIPFYFLCSPSKTAFALIVGTHFLIDRYRLARYVVFAKNFLAPRDILTWKMIPSNDEIQGEGGFVKKLEVKQIWPTWSDAHMTGYPSDAPPWLSVWLLIAADNCLHILLNGIALKYF